jgi:hypothetical protein
MGNTSLKHNTLSLSLEKIKESIVAVGHDTKDIKAKDEVYNNIDPCCKYRDEKVVKDHDN